MIKTALIIVWTLLCLNFGNKTYGKSQQELTAANVKGNTTFTIRGIQGSVVKITCWRNQFYKFDYLLDTTINFKDQTIQLSVHLDQLAYLRLSRIEPGKITFHTDFLLEKGDDLQFTLQDRDIMCTGKGADRFNVGREVTVALSKMRIDPDQFKDKLVWEKQLINANAVLATTLQVWQNHRSLFDQLTYQTNLIDLTSLAHNKNLIILLNALKNTQFKQDLAYADRVKNAIAQEMAKPYQANLDSKLLPYSYWYREACVMEAILLENQQSAFTAEDETSKIFEHLYGQYTGELRNFLLLHWLAKRIKQTEPHQFNSMLARVTLADTNNNSVLRDALAQFKEATKLQVKSYADGLPDSNGKLVKLSDFKGKIVLVDFWYTGCINCIKYGEQTLNPAYQKLKQDPDIVFLSVSIDKDKEAWLKSLRSGAYTLPTGINLYTAGAGSKHPILDYYQVISYPQMLVLDKNGAAYSTAYTTKDPNQLISLLTQLKTTN